MGNFALSEYRVRHKDGRWLHVEDRAKLVRDDAGKLHRIVGCVVDVTEQRLAEERLRYNESFNHALLSASLVGMCVFDVDAGWNLFINPQYTKITGYTQAD